MTRFWQRRRVLVTGGASFIGSHLVERLVAAGARVRVADNLSSGRLANLRAVISDIDFRRGDLRDRRFAERACRGQTLVVHLAARHGGRGFIDTHRAECASNAVLDGVVFGAAVTSGVERVCFASSACVYPISLQQRVGGRAMRLREDQARHDGPVEPDGEYGAAKWMGELALRAHHLDHGIGASICRLFTVYGERANETHAVMALIAKARLRLDPFPIWGNGRQRRNFTYVGDAVEGLMASAEHISDATPVNVGSADVVTIRALAGEILAATGFRPRAFRFEPHRPVGVLNRASDLTRARRLIGWQPRTPLADGLARAIDWHRAQHSDAALRRRLAEMLTEPA